ncbi:MAG: diaminopimelate epimerase [Phycisphaerae bacterium]|nr:diaminopimelate epimerase [Phycisphaerae bacterium]
MRFTKMHGLGNDYVYVNCFEEQVADPPSLAKVISDRHTGVGSDGLILIRPTQRADVRMEMYNADGSRAQMCGNGIRCVAKYAYDHGLIKRFADAVPGANQDEQRSILQRAAEAGASPGSRHLAVTVETDAGVKTLGLAVVDEKVQMACVDMGVPSLRPSDLPCTLEGDRIVDHPVEIAGRSYAMTCVSVGNPHAVIFTDDLASIDLTVEGPPIENAGIFPQRINAHFVRLDGRGEVTMVTWERGSGVTLACGTGATAVCVAGAVSGRTDRRILAHLPGGDLGLNWAEDDHVYMTGPATEVFTGQWTS